MHEDYPLPYLAAAAAAAAGGPSPPFGTMMLPDGSIKQLQPGEGSSSAPMPPSFPAAAAAPVVTKGGASRIFLNKYRNKCINTQYLIKEVSKDGVEYYEFKEVEDTDNVISPGVQVGEVGWVKVLKPVSQFKDYCTEEDREIFSFLKEENLDIFLGAPAEVMETAADYASSGLVSPIPIPAPDISVPVIAPTAVQANVPVEITEPMLKGIRIQQGASGIMNTNYNVLYTKGMTMYPVFIYGSEGDNVLHLTTTVLDGKLSFTRDSTNKKMLNTKFKRITASIISNIEAGMYTPSDNIQEELQNALREVADDISSKISSIYDPIRISGYTYFGDLGDEAMPVPDMPYYSPQMFGDSMPVESFNMNIGPKSSNKKATEMTIPELEERMKMNKGVEYAREYMPEKYTNAMGIMNIRYVKRPNVDSPALERPPLFTEFGVGSDDEELLFD